MQPDEQLTPTQVAAYRALRELDPAFGQRSVLEATRCWADLLEAYDAQQDVTDMRDFAKLWLAAQDGNGDGPLPCRADAPVSHLSAVTIAATYLAKAGLTVLDQGWCCDEGGISVIASEGSALVPVYLRLAAGGRYCAPLDELGARHAEILHLTARWCREKNRLFPEVRIDVIGLIRDGANGYTIEHVRGVTR